MHTLAWLVDLVWLRCHNGWQVGFSPRYHTVLWLHKALQLRMVQQPQKFTTAVNLLHHLADATEVQLAHAHATSLSLAEDLCRRDLVVYKIARPSDA